MSYLVSSMIIYYVTKGSESSFAICLEILRRLPWTSLGVQFQVNNSQTAGTDKEEFFVECETNHIYTLHDVLYCCKRFESIQNSKYDKCLNQVERLDFICPSGGATNSSTFIATMFINFSDISAKQYAYHWSSIIVKRYSSSRVSWVSCSFLISIQFILEAVRKSFD